MAGSFEGVYTDDEGLASGTEYSMLGAMGSAGQSKGTELDSPEENFNGSSMSPGALGNPGNSLPSVSNGSTPSGDGSFDCLADSYPKF